MPLWTRRARLTSALVLAAAASVVLFGQEPTFKTGTEIVSLFVTVVDAQGRLVPDLTKDDFEILDNDKVQPIIYFENIIQPISVVVMLDTSGSMTGSISLLKDAAEQFLLRLLPADQGRVGAFNDKIQISAHFTKNRDELIGDVKELDFGNGTRLWDALYESIGALKQEPARKVVVVLSDGDDTTSKMSGGDDVLAAALANDVMIYTVGLRTHYRGGYNGSMIEGRPDRNLKKLSEHTGGGFFELSKSTELNATFSKVADELHRQYLLAITAQSDGKPHTIGVRVKQPGMTVRARKTYLASAPAK